MTNHPPSVLWHCWLGHQTCKNRRPYNLYCVGADIKPCSINRWANPNRDWHLNRDLGVSGNDSTNFGIDSAWDWFNSVFFAIRFEAWDSTAES